MKTTLDLPDELMRTIKVKAAREDRTLKDLVAELLRRGLAEEVDEQPGARHRVQLPIIHSAHPAAPGALTPERVAQILLDQEVDWALNR